MGFPHIPENIYKTRNVSSRISARNRLHIQIRINWPLFNKGILFKEYGKNIQKP